MIATQKKLDDTDKKIISLCSQGKTAKEIGYELNLKPKSVSKRVDLMKKYYQCKSIAHLVDTVRKLPH